MEKLTIDYLHKKKMIDIFVKDLNGFICCDIARIVWNTIKRKKDFVDDKKLNSYIVEYVNKNGIDDYKTDLINIISPVIKEINLKEKDPQEISVIPFMIQQNLLWEIQEQK